ncbi:HAD family hydrolase [Streptomyces omiyaensis]|uniref:HAD family hydrolase n=1 Tax=Streptomyces omiyaensis TaxID=68247 RepID=UPI0036F8657E
MPLTICNDRGVAYAAYAFDFDGTLVDTTDLNHRCVQASLAAHGITVSLGWVAERPVFTAAQLRRRLGIGADALPEDSYLTAAQTHWHANTDLLRPIHAGASAAREAAERAPVAVVTANYAALARRALTLVGLDDLPWLIVGREEVPHSKPAPDVYLYAARQMGVAPGECLAHEDTDEGISAARAAGMDVIDIRERGWRP